jgi:hypothetical protein
MKGHIKKGNFRKGSDQSREAINEGERLMKGNFRKGSDQ